METKDAAKIIALQVVPVVEDQGGGVTCVDLVAA